MHNKKPNEDHLWTKVEDGLPETGMEVECKYGETDFRWTMKVLYGHQWIDHGSATNPPTHWRYKAPEAKEEKPAAELAKAWEAYSRLFGPDRRPRRSRQVES